MYDEIPYQVKQRAGDRGITAENMEKSKHRGLLISTKIRPMKAPVWPVATYGNVPIRWSAYDFSYWTLIKTVRLSCTVIAKFHYTGPTGPARTFLRPGSPRNSVGSVRVSDKVRAGPRGSGRARAVEFSLYWASRRKTQRVEIVPNTGPNRLCRVKTRE